MFNLKQTNQNKKFEYLIDGKTNTIKPADVLSTYKKRFSSAYANTDTEIYDAFELAYRGTTTTTANVNSRQKKAIKKTNVNRNISYEMIESQINTTVPEPQVISRKAGYEEHAKMIEEKIKSDIDYLLADRMSDTLERHTYTNGVGLVLVNWNTNKGGHNELGEKEFLNIHPKQIVTQPSVYEFKEMDQTYFVLNTTKENIREKYGIDVSDESISYRETNQIIGDTGYDVKSKSEGDLVTAILCYYKDKDYDIGKIVWVGDTIVEFEPKYFYPRVAVCQECGYEMAQGTEVCTECGSKKIKTDISTYETIEEDLLLSPISHNVKKKVVVDDPQGKRIITNLEEKIVERMVPKGTKIKRFALKQFPIVKRINIPLAFSFRGISDIEVISSLQESLKKTLSRIEEKILLAPVMIGMPKKMSDKLSSDIYQVLQGSPADLSQIVFHDLKADITQDLEYAQTLYQYAKSTIGVTDAFQGKYDPSARTGKAKEVQVQQSAGRLESKYKNKYIFYRELFEMMYFFDLMFTQETRSYMTKDAMGQISYKDFNKYELLCKDDAGEWYYNTDFIFKARQSSEIPSDDVSVMNKTLELAQAGFIDKDQLWQILDELNFPVARQILDQTRSQMDQKVELLLGALKGLSPEMLPQFLQRPLEEQMEMLNQILDQQKPKQ